MRSSSVLMVAVAVLGGVDFVAAQVPLVNKRYPYAGVPYQVDTVVRGPTGARGRRPGCLPSPVESTAS